jgi:arylsulfatase A-like enzyme
MDDHTPAPNIVLILTDQLRQDYVGLYAEKSSLTPNIDALCGQHFFTRCTTINPVCMPARTAMLTGRYTRQIGTVAMSGDMDRDIPTFPQALHRAGYHTIGVGKFHYLQSWDWDTPRGKGHNLQELRPHFNQWGFDEVWQVCGKSQLTRNYCDYAAMLESAGMLEAYRDDVEARGYNCSDAEKEDVDCSGFRFDPNLYVDRVIGDKALEDLDKRPRGRPFFSQISFCGPHPPYDPPAEALAKFELEEADDFIPNEAPLSPAGKQVQYRKRRAYKAMIHEIDQQVGRLRKYLEKEGVLENTVILFTSDHGEMMGDHGLSQKTSPFWQASRVPLYIRVPWQSGQKAHNCLVENIDITATILDAAGLDPEKALARPWPAAQAPVPAKSLLPVIAGRQSIHRDFVFSESSHLWEMIESGKYKYIRKLPWSCAEGELLYDLEADPDERTNVAHQPEYKDMLEQARRQRMAIHDHYPACQTRWTHIDGRA